MAKRISAKVGEYQKDGETKGEYVKVGVILNGDNGEYVLLEPFVSLGGILAQQNALAMEQGKKVRSTVMAGIFEDQPQQQAPQPQYQQPQQQQYSATNNAGHQTSQPQQQPQQNQQYGDGSYDPNAR